MICTVLVDIREKEINTTDVAAYFNSENCKLKEKRFCINEYKIIDDKIYIFLGKKDMKTFKYRWLGGFFADLNSTSFSRLRELSNA